MNKDFEEQLMILADEKISFEELKRSSVETYLIKLDQHCELLSREKEKNGR